MTKADTIKTTKKTQLFKLYNFAVNQSNNVRITDMKKEVRKANLYDLFKRIAIVPN